MYGFLKLCNVYMYYCVHVYVHMIKLMRSCQYVYLACTGSVGTDCMALTYTCIESSSQKLL